MPIDRTGMKYDQDKVRMSLVIDGFADSLFEVGKIATFGAEKYAAHSWKGVPDGLERYTDAMYRHLNAEAQGEEMDDESEMMHAAHTAWNALARLHFLLENKKKNED